MEEKKIGIISMSFNAASVRSDRNGEYLVNDHLHPFVIEYANMVPKLGVIRQVKLRREHMPQDVLDALQATAERIIEIARELDEETVGA